MHFAATLQPSANGNRLARLYPLDPEQLRPALKVLQHQRSDRPRFVAEILGRKLATLIHIGPIGVQFAIAVQSQPLVTVGWEKLVKFVQVIRRVEIQLVVVLRKGHRNVHVVTKLQRFPRSQSI